MKVMQCWDDAVVTDIRLVQLLKRYSAKSTFNINPGLAHPNARQAGNYVFRGIFRVDRLTIEEMIDVYEGFCIAGHSMTHPNLPDLDEKTLKDELTICKDFISEKFKQEKCGFAYPCGRYNDAVKEAISSAGYAYARTTVNVADALPLHDPMALHSHCHFMHDDFWDKYEKVKEQDGVFYFWGHSYEMMNDELLWNQFEEKLERISADPDAEWINIIDLF